MPFLIPVFAAVASAVAAVGAAVATVGTTLAVAAGVGDIAAIAFGTAFAGFLGSVALSAALTFGLQEANHLLFAQHSAIGGNSVAFKADPNAGYPYAIGRTGVGGNIVFADTSDDGHNTWLHYFTALSHGPIDAIESFTANNVPVTFNSDGSVANLGYNWRGVYSSGTAYNINDGVSFDGGIYICVATALGYDPSNTDYWASAGTYAGPRWTSKMWQLQTLGTQPDTALPSPAGAGNIPEWSAANALSGIAHTRWALQYDAGAYPTGTPKPLWVLRGAKVYDPRQDSTYPGGSGAQRWNDPTTWVWSRNPYCHALTWCIGQTNNGVRVLGLGAPIGAIDVPAFVVGANVADANGWFVGGQVFSTDSKWDVFSQMLAAGGGFPKRLGAAISCVTDTPRVSIATLTGADFTGAVSVQAVASRRNRPNSVKYTYRSEAHQWAAVQADEVTVAEYVAADGVKRAKGVQMPLVQDVDQGAQLARYVIEDAREFGPITGPVKAKWLGLQPGDCITVNEPEYGLNNQKILILDRRIDPATATATLTARSETDAKHPFALGQTGTAPPAPNLSGIDLIAPAPNAPPWSAVGGTVSSAGGAFPAIIVTGTMESSTASNLVIRTRLSAGPGPWEHYDSPPQSAAGRTVITGVGSGEVRDIGLSYLVRGVPGLELVIPDVTAGDAATAWTEVTGSGKPADGATRNVVTYGPTAPATHVDGDIWVNTGATPPVVNVYQGGVAEPMANLVTGTGQLSDTALLGQTALWASVTGANRPADGATKNIVTYSATAPTGAAVGDIWVNSSTGVTYVWNGAWVAAANYVTDTSQLTDGAGLGSTAEWTGVSGKPVNLTTPMTSAPGSGGASVSSASPTEQFYSATLTIPASVPGHYNVSATLGPGGSPGHTGSGSVDQNVVVGLYEEASTGGSANLLSSSNDTLIYSLVDGYDIQTGAYSAYAPSTLTGSVRVGVYIAWRGSSTHSFSGYAGTLYVTWTPD